MFRITIYTEPVAQARARATVINGHVKMYDPAKSRDEKTFIKYVIREEVTKQGVELMTGAVGLEAKFYRSIPKSFGIKKTKLAESGALRPITKPDTDNYIKLLKDACKGVLWKDDSQVVDEHPQKFYSLQPRIELWVWKL